MYDDYPQGLGDGGCVWGVGEDGDLYGVAGAVAEEWCALDGGGAGGAVVVGDLVPAFSDVLGDGGCYAVSVDEVLEEGINSFLSITPSLSTLICKIRTIFSCFNHKIRTILGRFDHILET